MPELKFEINDVPVKVSWTAEVVTLDAGQDRSMRHIYQHYSRKDYGITRMNKSIAHGLAMAAAKEWWRVDYGGEW